MSTITMDYLINHKFEKSGLEEIDDKRPNVSGMFSSQELGRLPKTDEQKMADLKIKISDLIREKCGGYNKLYVKTNINPETMKKSLRLNLNRGIKREMLAKFVVGIGLSLEEANELFSLLSYPLNASTTRLDAVVVHCIEQKLDIHGFLDTCKQIKLDITVSN
ncbi:MAG: hypothetical protein K2N90_08160 [Lachnospiraceae bacterium]|nr:hypothetical protein [Lachnospiraceae bacterium]